MLADIHGVDALNIYSRRNHVRRKISFRLLDGGAEIRSLVHSEPLPFSVPGLATRPGNSVTFWHTSG